MIGIWLLIMKFSMRRVASNPSSKKLFLGTRTIKFSDENIRIKTAASDSTMDWSTIQKMSQSKKSYFLHLRGIQAIIVSKRAFKNEEYLKI
ncbi:MAG: hypothetical protein ACI9XO_004091 [Paraglaciecola sp.]|jgi:hypothetical protein